MRLLLDTHALVWFLEDAPTLSDHAAKAIEAAGSHCFVSAASIWELAIKSRLGKIKLPYSLHEGLPDLLARNGIEVLPIDHLHAAAVAQLPLHHGDPFDRLLVAVAQQEKLILVSRDAIFDAYDVRRIW